MFSPAICEQGGWSPVAFDLVRARVALNSKKILVDHGALGRVQRFPGDLQDRALKLSFDHAGSSAGEPEPTESLDTRAGAVFLLNQLVRFLKVRRQVRRYLQLEF